MEPQKLDWTLEFKEFEWYVSSFEFSSLPDAQAGKPTQLSIKTKEGLELKFDLNPSGPGYTETSTGKTYESMQQILDQYSPEYWQEFMADLFNKLS